MEFDLSRWSLRALFKFRSGVQGQEVREHRVTNPFHAVSIVTGTYCCAAARQYADRRFLSSEAPRLPLEACTATECRCRYRHHDDRRRGPRRAADGGFARPYGGQERRTRAGRRETDA